MEKKLKVEKVMTYLLTDEFNSGVMGFVYEDGTTKIRFYNQPTTYAETVSRINDSRKELLRDFINRILNGGTFKINKYYDRLLSRVQELFQALDEKRLNTTIR